MHKQDGLSATHEMYLKIIYQLRESGDPARVGQMAKGLGVHRSTASAVVGTLAKMGLVTHDPYGIVKLTDLGERLAVCVVHRFETLCRFLTDVLDMDAESAQVEACEVEHAVSPELISRLDQLTHSLRRMGFEGSFKPTAAIGEPFCSECIQAGECTAAQAVTHD